MKKNNSKTISSNKKVEKKTNSKTNNKKVEKKINPTIEKAKRIANKVANVINTISPVGARPGNLFAVNELSSDTKKSDKKKK